MSTEIFTKQPGERLDYDVEFEDWMPPGDSIASQVTTILFGEVGLINDSNVISVSTHSVKVWLDAGNDLTTYHIETKITTVGGRKKSKDFRLKIKEVI